VPPGVSPKKHALTKAIDFAKNDVITITDADCTVPSTWLETIDCNFGSEVNMLQGVTSYKKTHPVNHWLFNLQAVDFASHAIVSAAGIGAGVPINSNANNLSFRRNGFIEMGGYGDKAGVVSGDDDMLLQRFNRKNPGSVKYMTDAKGAVTTVPTATFGGVFEQRKRWGSKTVHYEPQQVLLLGTVFLFYLVTAAYAVFACFEPSIWRCFLILFGVKFLGECVLMLPGMKILGFKGLMQYLIPASIIQLPVVLAAVLLGVFGKFKWKDAVYRRTV
jgi:cellulose synthase/poly-beta-1,6-N-acetylglucosamine synthase-like glycosyltransferase